jgi:3-hydroxyisobutyrate dehydrogenase-like beta-hydroxyacid dehydrogenase
MVSADRTNKMPVGIVGIGKMGTPIAAHVARSGFPVVYHDANPTARGKGRRLDSCRDVAASADIILVIVGTDRDVRTCFAGPKGLLAGSVHGKAFVVLSTITPGTLAAITVAAERKGATVLDAPVVWGEQGAKQGRLVSYVGGDSKAFLRCKRVVSAYSKEVFYLGPSGAGLIAKTANNHLMWACRFANFEVLELASRYFSGDVKTLLGALLAGTGSNACLERIHAPAGGMPWAEKDLQIVMRMARDAGLPSIFAAAAKRAIRNNDHREFNEQGIEWLRKQNGSGSRTRLRNE